MEKLVLIDGNSLLNRAFYATPAFTTKDGLPTNGVFGFIKLVLKIISDKTPTHFAVAFDLRAPTFRHKMYADYKAGRKPMPEDLSVQVPVLKEVLRLMNIRICEKEGYEADDIIGTLAKKYDIQTYVYTGDRDSYQLVDENTNVCYTRKGVSDILELTAANFKDEIGLTPAQIIELKALMGDKSDNIPGVPGVGEVSATSLLNKYGDVDGIYAHIDEITGAMHRKLSENKESAYFSKTLATIDTNAPIDVELSECVLRMPFAKEVKDKFAELEFKSLLTKDIYAEVTEDEASSDTDAPAQPKTITEILPETIDEGIEIIEQSNAEKIACYLSADSFRFHLCENGLAVTTEYVFPIKIGLLDVGFYDYQLTPLLKAVYEGKKRVISYNTKETMSLLKGYGVVHLAMYDDVSILKCLADGLGNTDKLAFCLQYYSLAEKNCAYGLAYLYEEYIKQLRKEEEKLYYEVELPLVQVLFDMEVQGVCVDTKTLQEFSARYNTELNGLVEKIYELAGERFNINSTQQLGKILFEKLKIGEGVKKNKDSKNYKTTAEELEKYADSSEIVRYLLRYRKIQKINSTYIEGFKPLIVNSKVHTTYNQSLTQTGRLSSVNPNLQNIPVRTEEGRELRKLFTASEGNVLIDADYSQIELRLLAHFSGCKELIDAYCEGKDIHSITASQVFNVALDDVTTDMRRDAKAVNFGIIYGISAFGLASDLGISSKKAKEYIDRYFETYSDVKTYMTANVDTAKQNGYVETLLGRRRVINELKSSNFNVRSFGERAAMNMPLQGSSADIIKIAMIRVATELQKGGYKARLVLQVHDELIIDCPQNEAEEVSKILKHEMENAVSLQVPLTVEVGIGKTWYESK
ncbi:MAG: DNA polymerase I [Clostridia bacterium]|nr:DNA polymerase I [Clostridia bacterium]